MHPSLSFARKNLCDFSFAIYFHSQNSQYLMTRKTYRKLKRGDENELKRKLRLEKVVASKLLRLAMGHGTEEERRAKKGLDLMDLIWI